MDIPVHIAGAAMTGNMILYAALRTSPQPISRWRTINIGLGCFLGGILSHFALDAVPYYDWLFYVDIFRPLPYSWLIPPFLAAIPVLIYIFAINRDHWLLTGIAITGGMYPDIEKTLYLDWRRQYHWLKSLVIFRDHSLKLSQWTAWERNHKAFLIGMEIGVLVVLLTGMYWFALRRRLSDNT